MPRIQPVVHPVGVEVVQRVIDRMIDRIINPVVQMVVKPARVPAVFIHPRMILPLVSHAIGNIADAFADRVQRAVIIGTVQLPARGPAAQHQAAANDHNRAAGEN